ncbi:recombination-associated protein RdgC [Pseudoalteromonas sp. R3]|uniref:recombination-associated protein RdgC n=1 Tax=Pseudoalteromonas sp. R3 TaxID=1709477 RepID=UPI0009E6D7DD|nr:recombination-associated protein RdgC [Pseudoalteromonas sp. R3]
MFIPNAIAYKFKEIPSQYLDAETLESALAQDRSRRCGSQEAQTFGWTTALGDHGDKLAHVVGDKILLCAKRYERVIPASVVNEMMHEKIKLIETEEGRTVKKKERDEIKENILQTITPQAFEKSSNTHILIDLTKGFVFVNASSFNKAEEALALLRKSVGTLPVAPLFANVFIDTALTEFVAEQTPPEHFTFGGTARLSDTAEASSEIVLKERDLQSEEVQELMQNTFVTVLELKYKDQVTFTLDSKGTIKRIKYSDIIKERNGDIPLEDMAAKLSADFILIITELTELATALHAAIRTKIDDGYEGAPPKIETASFPQEESQQDPEDPLYSEAEAIVIRSKNALVSSLQRSLRIGYNRATRLIEAMEAKGIVTAPGHNGVRDVIAA